MQATSKYAIGVIILSGIVTLTGNVFLGFLGLLAGGLTLGNGLQRSPDLIFMLCFFMSITTMMHLFAVLPFGFYLLGSQPERVCGISRAMVNRFEMPFEGATLAGGQGTRVDAVCSRRWQLQVQARLTSGGISGPASRSGTRVDLAI